MRQAAAVFAAGLLLAGLAAAPALGQTAGSLPPKDPNALTLPPTQGDPPAGHRRTASAVVAIADRQPRIIAMRRRHRGTTRAAYLKGPVRWQVSYFAKRRDPDVQGKELAQVIIDDATGRPLETWTGHQVAWSMARGYAGAFGRKSNALYVWIPLCLLFILPFVDPRRPFRLIHLDLLVLLGFSASLAVFNHGDIGVSVPLAYPPLLYLLVRLLWAARVPTPGRPRRPINLLVPATWLVVGLIFLVAFRIGLNVTNSNVIDVGYAGVIGADNLVDGDPLYGAFPDNNAQGDTYGPVNYYAYVPFEQTWAWSGRWDDLPAAHGAAIFFDLLTMLGLWLLGRRIRGPTLGVALAYAWAAFPFTLFTLNSNSNDSIVAATVVGALLLASSPPARGAMTAVAGLTKFAPFALAPLLATYRAAGGRARPRELLVFAAGFALALTVLMLPPLTDGGLRLFYERTIDYQGGRDSPFSLWGIQDGLGGLHTAVKVFAVGLALAVAFVPRRRDLASLAALAGAVLIGVQLTVEHWFYLYIVWFLPVALVALLGRDLEPRRPGPRAPARTDPEREAAVARSRQRVPALTR